MAEYNRTPKFWTDSELDRLAIRFIGDDELKLEKARDLMESGARLPIHTLDSAIKRVAKVKDGVVKLTEASLDKFKKFRGNYTQNN